MLIGWQIYNAIIIEKKIKDEVKLIEKSFQKEIQAIKMKVKSLQKKYYTRQNILILSFSYQNIIRQE